MKYGSLFSGIGGFDRGFDLAGFNCAWQVECDRDCRAVLDRNFPGVPRYWDVRDFDVAKADDVEVIIGGFPCTDISDASSRYGRAGLHGERSGLWEHFARIVDDARPRWVCIENVAGSADASLRRWLPYVRRDLHSLGYASLPIRMSACAVGAPYAGARIFVVAAPNSERESIGALHAAVAQLHESPEAMRTDWGQPSPEALGVAHRPAGGLGVVKQLRMYGNAVVPKQAEVIARLIAEVS